MRVAGCGHEFLPTDAVCRECGQPMRLGMGAAKGVSYRKLVIGVVSVSAFLGLALSAAFVMLASNGRKAMTDPVTQNDLQIARQKALNVTTDQSSRLIPGAPDAQAMFPPDEKEDAAKTPAVGHPADLDVASAPGDDPEDADTEEKAPGRIVIHRAAAGPVAEGGEAMPMDPLSSNPGTAAVKKPAGPTPVEMPSPVPMPAGSRPSQG